MTMNLFPLALKAMPMLFRYRVEEDMWEITYGLFQLRL